MGKLLDCSFHHGATGQRQAGKGQGREVENRKKVQRHRFLILLIISEISRAGWSWEMFKISKM